MEITQMPSDRRMNELYHDPLPIHSRPSLVVYFNNYIKQKIKYINAILQTHTPKGPNSMYVP